MPLLVELNLVSFIFSSLSHSTEETDWPPNLPAVTSFYQPLTFKRTDILNDTSFIAFLFCPLGQCPA